MTFPVALKNMRLKTFRFSKRDISNCFESLQAPLELHPFFGRPSITVQNLLDTGKWTLESLTPLIDDLGHETVTGDTRIFPCSTSWPQGFSWSSCVAQECSLSLCRLTGLRDEQILSLDSPVPPDAAELAAVCTDDTIFIHRDPVQAAHRVALLDHHIAEAGLTTVHSCTLDLG